MCVKQLVRNSQQRQRRLYCFDIIISAPVHSVKVILMLPSLRLLYLILLLQLSFSSSDPVQRFPSYPAISDIFHMGKESSPQNSLGIETVLHLSPLTPKSEQHMIVIQHIFLINQYFYVFLIFPKLKEVLDLPGKI